MTISKLSTALGAGSTIPTAGRFAQISSGGTRTTYTDGGVTYEVRTFTSSGSLVVANSGVVDLLVIGGGGAGGCDSANNVNYTGAGGGAGGAYSQTAFYLPAGTHTVTIGAGAASSTDNLIMGNGVSSSIGSLAIGPGGGTGGGLMGAGNDYSPAVTAVPVAVALQQALGTRLLVAE